MTARHLRTVIRLNACAPEARDAFVRRFTDYTAGSRDAPIAARAAYAESVVSVALARPSELLLALENDTVVGRALVAESFAEPGACGIGLYAVTPGEAARATAAALVAAARSWAAKRGCRTIYAPIDVNTWFSYRFMLPGAPGAPAARRYSWEPSHPAEYVSHFRALGFTDAERYRSDFIRLSGGHANDVARHTAGAVTRAVAAGFAFEHLGAHALGVLDELHPLCLDAFRHNRLFEPVTLAVFRATITATSRDRDISHSHVARDASGRVVGFVLAIREDDALVIKTLAVSPSAQRCGLATALVHLAVDGAAHRGMRTLAMALVHAGNASEAFAAQYTLPGSTTWTHEYVLLESSVAAAKDAR